MIDIFQNALHIESPWFINDIKFSEKERRLDVYVDFERGTTFPYEDPETGLSGVYKAYDTKDKTWRHLDYFEYSTYIHCRTPRVKANGKVRLIKPPWSGKANGFTLLFEAWLVSLCKEMPVATVSKKMRIDDEKAWRVLDKYITEIRKLENMSEITRVGMDETSRRKGHVYISLFVDLDTNRTIHIAEGKDNLVVKDFSKFLTEHHGDPNKITDVSCDMSPAFIKGVGKYLPNSKITFDRFHIMKLINKAVDKTRKDEAIGEESLKGNRYLFLKNRKNLSKKQKKELRKLKLENKCVKSIKALMIRECFQNIYKYKSIKRFEKELKSWYYWATHCQLDHIVSVSKTIKNHWEGILNWKKSEINNGVLEGLNSVVQAAKSKARGYSTSKSFMIIAYLVTGKLDFKKINPACEIF